MTIISNKTDIVNSNGTFSSGGGDRAILKRNPSTPSAPSGEGVPFFVRQWNTPDGVNAKNFGGEALSEGAGPLLSPSLTSLVPGHRHMSAFGEKNAVWLAFVKAGKGDKADALMQCGRDVYISECERCGHRHKVQYHCKLRVCRKCAAIKLDANVKKYLPYILSVPLGSIRIGMVSIKNVDNLKEGVKKVRRCFTKLRHRNYYKPKIRGGIYGPQGKPGKDGKWKVHLHFLYEGSFIPQDRLSEDWKKITGDSFYVWIEDVHNPRKALEEVLRYVTQGVEPDDEEWTGESLVDFVLALSDVRLVQAFGSFLGNTAERTRLVCRECGYAFFRRLSLNGGIILSYPEQKVLREFKRTRPPPSVSLTWKRGL